MSNLLLHKSSFIHIPKCGGSMVQSILYRFDLVKHRYTSPQNGHLFLHQMTESKNTYNFCFVRHPYTWWPSFWNWSKRDRFSVMERECPDFDTWLKDYGPFWMGHYSKYLCRYIGEDPSYPSDIKMNFIGKMENLFVDLDAALKNSGEQYDDLRLGFFIKNIHRDPILSKSYNKQEYNKVISEKSKEIIYNTEKYVFDRFDYKP